MSAVKISVIMPAYNASKFIAEAMQSVIDQVYPNFELLVINDGSQDETEDIVLSFQDERIHYFLQPNSGVSAARNLGLSKMTGDFFCFLDADDLMPSNSLLSRLEVLQENPEVAFVGGGQEQYDEKLKVMISKQVPTYQGNPRKGLVALDSACFINCGTWMIRRTPGVPYHFPVGWTHSEDLAFFISIARSGDLRSIPNVAQLYRRHQSAMSDLDGLRDGYIRLFFFIRDHKMFANDKETQYFIRRVKRIMLLSYLRDGQIMRGLGVLLLRFG